MVGDVYNKFEQVANGAALTCQPVAGQEVVIHNIFHPGNVEIVMKVGADECSFFEEEGKNLLTNMYFHITNTQYLLVYNRSGGAIYIAVDGVITKEP